MKNLDSAISAMDSAWATYERSVYRIAEMLFNSRVLPLLKERGWRFLSGNGTYYLSDSGGHLVMIYDISPDDSDAVEVVDLLEAEIPGMGENCLGSLMPDYDPNSSK